MYIFIKIKDKMICYKIITILQIRQQNGILNWNETQLELSIDVLYFFTFQMFKILTNGLIIYN